MTVTARCSGMLLSRRRTARTINNGMQPRCTRRKEKLPENQQPCQDLSAMRKHALWDIEDKIKNSEPDQCSHAMSSVRLKQRRKQEELINFVLRRKFTVHLSTFSPMCDNYKLPTSQSKVSFGRIGVISIMLQRCREFQMSITTPQIPSANGEPAWEAARELTMPKRVSRNIGLLIRRSPSSPCLS